VSRNYDKILIIKPSSLGDIVLALPTLSALRTSFPQAHISWLVRTQFAQLLENHPFLDDIVLFDRELLGKAWCNVKAFSSLLSLVRRLKREKFDLVLDLQGLFRSAALGYICGCKRRYGMSRCRELAHIFYTNRVEQPPDCVHLVDYYLEIAASAGAEKTGVEFVLPEFPSAVESVGRMLMNYDISAAGYAVLVPGSAHKDKRWCVERFAAVADKISGDFGLSVVAVGTEHEKELIQRLNDYAKVRTVSLAGRTNIKELVELLRLAKVVISNDTGPGHIAAALDVPSIMVFGRSNPARVAPYGKGGFVAAVDAFDRGAAINSSDPRHDIKAVSVDLVYQKVADALK